MLHKLYKLDSQFNRIDGAQRLELRRLIHNRRQLKRELRHDQHRQLDVFSFQQRIVAQQQIDDQLARQRICQLLLETSHSAHLKGAVELGILPQLLDYLDDDPLRLPTFETIHHMIRVHWQAIEPLMQAGAALRLMELLRRREHSISEKVLTLCSLILSYGRSAHCKTFLQAGLLQQLEQRLLLGNRSDYVKLVALCVQLMCCCPGAILECSCLSRIVDLLWLLMSYGCTATQLSVCHSIQTLVSMAQTQHDAIIDELLECGFAAKLLAICLNFKSVDLVQAALTALTVCLQYTNEHQVNFFQQLRLAIALERMVQPMQAVSLNIACLQLLLLLGERERWTTKLPFDELTAVRFYTRVESLTSSPSDQLAKLASRMLNYRDVPVAAATV